jgi:hypothetical protein
MGGFEPSFYWMVGILSVFGFLLLVLAVAGLRPLRGTSWPGARPRSGWWARLRACAQAIGHSGAAAPLARNELLATLSNRSRCGDDPMLWKERHIRMGGGLRWLGSRPAGLFCGVLLGCYLFDVAYPLVGDLISGYGYDRSLTAVNEAMRSSSVLLAVLAMLPVGAAAATSLTGEREQDTWVSLATTLLTPAEIIRAKQLGALWSARWIGLALLVLWGAGVLMGGIHPLGVLAAAAIAAVAAWLSAAIGVLASTRAKNSTRALGVTFIALFVFVTLSRWPWGLWTSLVSYREFALWWSKTRPAVGELIVSVPGSVGAPALMLAGCATSAALLSFWAIRILRKTWGQA